MIWQFEREANNKSSIATLSTDAALDILEDYPESEVYLIAVRLDCQVSDSRLKQIHYVDLFPDWDEGFRKILSTIQHAM